MQALGAKPDPLRALRQWAVSPWTLRRELMLGWIYRFGVYGAINLLDDPAWLALMFC
jgi:hypothetical protein